MRYIQLAPGLPASSVLGFGCGGIMGRIGRKASLRAIEEALDAGITHFDVARSYGHGEAEALLGQTLRGRRDRVVVASKLGIDPPRSAAALAWIKPLARQAIAIFPGLRRTVRRGAAASVARHRFSLEAARRSLDASLSALRTDHLDILLLHGPAPDDLHEALIAFLEDSLRQGKLRACGVAGSFDGALALQRAWPLLSLRQYANSILNPSSTQLGTAAGRSITHSPFDRAPQLLDWAFSRSADIASLGLPPIGTRELHDLMLAFALGANPDGVVICSMLSPGHLRANAATADRPLFSAEQVRRFAHWAQEHRLRVCH